MRRRKGGLVKVGEEGKRGLGKRDSGRKGGRGGTEQELLWGTVDLMSRRCHRPRLHWRETARSGRTAGGSLLITGPEALKVFMHKGSKVHGRSVHMMLAGPLPPLDSDRLVPERSMSSVSL